MIKPLLTDIDPILNRMDHMLVTALGHSPRANVLHISAGNENSLLWAAERYAEGHVIGVERSWADRSRASAALSDLSCSKHVTLLPGRAECLPIGRGSIDLAITVNPVQHWQSVEAAWEELSRVLRPGGTALVAEYSAADASIAAIEDLYLKAFDTGLSYRCRWNIFDGSEWVRIWAWENKGTVNKKEAQA